MEWDTIRFERDQHIGFLILDRPASLNAVNDQLILDMEAACLALQQEAELRVVVLKGEGRAFCSGMDLRAAANRPATPEALRTTWTPWMHALEILEHLPQLTIAAIQGPCLGAGFELTLACDFRIATTTAFFSSPQVLYGSPPDAGPTYKLPQLIGLAKALEIVILGERFDATHAERLGLLTKVVAPEALEAETQKLIERCLQVGQRAAIVAKRLLRNAWNMDSTALAEEIDRARSASLETGELSEAMQDYRERRRPRV